MTFNTKDFSTKKAKVIKQVSSMIFQARKKAQSLQVFAERPESAIAYLARPVLNNDESILSDGSGLLGVSGGGPSIGTVKMDVMVFLSHRDLEYRRSLRSLKGSLFLALGGLFAARLLREQPGQFLHTVLEYWHLLVLTRQSKSNTQHFRQSS